MDRENEAEIEVTPEMVEAGAREVWSALYDATPFGSPLGRETAVAVFRAMARSQRLEPS